jgi:hypothetical protein
MLRLPTYSTSSARLGVRLLGFSRHTLPGTQKAVRVSTRAPAATGAWFWVESRRHADDSKWADASRGWTIGGSEFESLLSVVQTGCGAQSGPYPMDTGIRRQGRQPDHSLRASVEVKQTCIDAPMAYSPYTPWKWQLDCPHCGSGRPGNARNNIPRQNSIRERSTGMRTTAVDVTVMYSVTPCCLAIRWPTFHWKLLAPCRRRVPPRRNLLPLHAPAQTRARTFARSSPWRWRH